MASAATAATGATAARTANAANAAHPDIPMRPMPAESAPSVKALNFQDMERLEAKIRGIEDKAKQRGFIKTLTEATRLALAAWIHQIIDV